MDSARRFMRNLTIRAKVFIMFVAILIIIMGLASVVFFSVIESVTRHEALNDLQGVVDWDASVISLEESMDNYGEAKHRDYHIPYKGGYLIIDGDFTESLVDVGAGLYDGKGNLLYGRNLIEKETSGLSFREGETRTVFSGKTAYYVYDRKAQNCEPQELWIRGEVNREQQHQEVSSIQRTCLFLMPIMILLAAAGANLIIRRSLRPIGQMAETARSISSGSDLRRRIDIQIAEGTTEKNEVLQLVTSFNEMMQKLERSFEAEKQFTSDVSHELRTPMSAILAQCEFSLEQGEELTREEAEAALQLIRRQGERMNDLISDMLTYTRIDRQHEKYPFGWVNLSRLTIETCQEFARMQEKGISVETDIEECISMSGSEVLLRRLLSNLISNGIRYGRENGHIRVKLQKAGNIILSVSDDGIGIAEEHLDRIFDRFYQVDPARSGEGIGLGLSMVKEIAEIHGGSVDVTSTLGEGSTFTVNFRILPDGEIEGQ